MTGSEKRFLLMVAIVFFGTVAVFAFGPPYVWLVVLGVGVPAIMLHAGRVEEDREKAEEHEERALVHWAEYPDRCPASRKIHWTYDTSLITCRDCWLQVLKIKDGPRLLRKPSEPTHAEMEAIRKLFNEEKGDER